MAPRFAPAVAVLIVLASTKPLMPQSAAPPAAEWVDRVLSVQSMVGSETPRWSPDGSRILFASWLGGGGLWTIPAGGGFPTRAARDIGSAGHFLASQLPAWSPNGEWISYISARSGRSEIWLWSATDGRDIQLTSLGGRINSMTWSPNGQWIAFAGDRFGNYDIWKVAVPTGELIRLTADRRYEVFPTWTPDSRRILYVQLGPRWLDHEVIEITANGAKPRVVVSDTDFFDYGAGTTFGYPAVSPDGRTVLFRSQRSGWINYWVVPLAGGEPRPIASEAADQSQASWSPEGTWVAYVSNHNGTHQLRVVAAVGGQPRVLVAPRLGVVASPEWSPDGTRLSYTLATPTRAADLFVVSLADGTSIQLTESAPGGNIERQLVVPEKIAYTASDGLEINAYLYRPAIIGKADRFPGIIYVHGGPTSQFHDAYDAQVQFLVKQGYVLLLPNVRGSSGFGRAFEKANNRDWGHGDLQDVIGAVDYLKKLPYVNPERMGITGTSYGAHLATAAIVWAPGIFHAAIAASGYPNRIAFMAEGEFRHLQQLEYEFGPYAENQDVYYRNSPFFWIKDIQTPTFLLNGEGRFPGSPQMRDFANEMERLYKVVRYKAYPNENYYVQGRSNRRQMLLDMLVFFDQYLKE